MCETTTDIQNRGASFMSMVIIDAPIKAVFAFA